MADLSDGPLPEVEWRIIRPDGELRWVRAKRTFVRRRRPAADPAGRVHRGHHRPQGHRDLELERSSEWFEALRRDRADRLRHPGLETRASTSTSARRTSRSSAGHGRTSTTTRARRTGWPTRDAAAGRGGSRPRRAGSPGATRHGSCGRTGDPAGCAATSSRPRVTRQRRWLASTVEDITARRANEEQLRSLVDADIVGVMVADPERIVDANDRSCRSSATPGRTSSRAASAGAA